MLEIRALRCIEVVPTREIGNQRGASRNSQGRRAVKLSVRVSSRENFAVKLSMKIMCQYEAAGAATYGCLRYLVRTAVRSRDRDGAQ